MAEQSDSAAKKPADTKTHTVGHKSDAQYAAFFSDFLRRYVPSNIERQKDILDGRFRIELTIPLPEYSTKTASAYSVTDSMDGEKRLFALVCTPNSMQRHGAIQALRTFSHPNLLQLVTSGVVQLSHPEAERFVIIYERPQGQRLSEMLANAGPLGEQFLTKNLIAPIASLIHAMSELEIPHGRINPDNIYFQDAPVLGDCVSEPCGFSQQYYFEPLERIQAHPAGKGDGSAAEDYYALAVLVIYALNGHKHFADLTPELLMNMIFKEGLYNALTRHKEHPEIYYDLLRGMLSHNPADRWSYKQIKPWLDGKRFNVLPPPPPAEAVRPFDFDGKEADTRRELAHLFFLNWVNIPLAMHNNQLLHWVAVSLRNKVLAENITRITKTLNELGAKSEIQFNEQLMRILLLLDPVGPLRMSPLSFHPDGIDTLCAEYYLSRQEKELNLLARFIDLNMISFWVDLQRKDKDYTITAGLNSIMLKLDRLRVCMRNTGPGFGLERILYELNPEMPCLSPLFHDKIIDNLQPLLVRLDRLAADLAKTHEPLDRHIFAFLASKLGIQHDIRLHELESIPALAASRDIIALRLLAIAQFRCGTIQLPGLTHWMGSRILPALDYIRSNTLRHKMKEMLMETAESGYTQHMAKLIINSSYATSDHEGFGKAYRTYHSSTTKIASLRRGDNIDVHSMRLGYIIAKTFAYIGFLITLVSVLRDGSI